jgi:hypothetical protein
MLQWDDNRLGLVFDNLATSTTWLPSDELYYCEVSVLDFYLDLEPSSEDIAQTCGLCRLEALRNATRRPHKHCKRSKSKYGNSKELHKCIC